MPDHWEVRIHRKVNDVVHALPLELATTIRVVIGKLQQTPFPADCRLVGSFNDVFEIFVNSHRIVYQVQEVEKRVKIARVHLASEVD
ncbi:hypothetical protein KC906_02675 [Candidatus Kaiserbacteria bacterium]|nr:hypothetical protein [Candidatus Kaiserbacteria bacterium]